MNSDLTAENSAAAALESPGDLGLSDLPTVHPSRKAPPTLEDLGKILGLSKRAVSQALNDRSATVKVSLATKERVLKLARTLGYRKNMAAAALTTKRSGMFGILTSVGRMHVGAIHLASAVGVFRGLGLSPLVIHDEARDQTQHDLSLSALINAGVDGVVLMRRPAHFSDRHVEELRNYGMSVVQVGSTTPGNDICHYLTDRGQAFKLVVDHLAGQGYKRIGAIVSNDEHILGSAWYASGMQTRIAILEAVNQARNSGSDLSLEIFSVPESREDPSDIHLLYSPGYDAMREIIARGDIPEAIICQVDGWAWGAMRACGEAGIRIPEDIAITGYSNEPSGSATYVPLTSIAEPFEEMCRSAITELVSSVREERPAHRRSVVMPCELVVRKSSLRPLR